MNRFALAMAAFVAVAAAHSTADACWLSRGLFSCHHDDCGCYDYCGCDCGYASCGYVGYGCGCNIPSCGAPTCCAPAAPTCCAPAPSCCAPSVPSCSAPAAPSCCAPCGCH